MLMDMAGRAFIQYNYGAQSCRVAVSAVPVMMMASGTLAMRRTERAW